MIRIFYKTNRKNIDAENGETTTFKVTNGTNGSNANLASVAPTLTSEKDYRITTKTKEIKQ